MPAAVFKTVLLRWVYDSHFPPEASSEAVGSSVHTQQAAVFARVCDQSTKTLEEIKLNSDKTHVLMMPT